MRVLLRTLLIILALTVRADAQTTIRVAGNTEFPVPANWFLATDTLEFPIQLIYYNDSAEILLFRSELRGDDAIRNETELKASVDLVINDVIGTLPEGQLLTSTGFYESFRTGFVIEFGSSDSTSGTPLKHSLKSVIYRHSDEYQIMYTIWGKATSDTYPDVADAIEQVQKGFKYTGVYEDRVFASAPMSYWMLALIGLALAGLVLLRPRLRRKPVRQDTA